MFRFDWTPFFCRTKYQQALARMFKKLDYRMHKELDLSNMIKSIRKNESISNAFFNMPKFEEANLKQVKEHNHMTIADIDLDSEASEDIEFAE